MTSIVRSFRCFALVASLSFVVAPLCAQAVKVDSKLKSYKATSGISGNLSSVGSDTLNNLMTLWAESFQKTYPSVRIQIEGKGSGTAPPALIKGTAQIGPMSRKMKDSEIDAFEKKFGYKPTMIPVAIDALAVYLNKDNPLEKLTLQQVDAIFSSTRKGGLPAIDTWGEAGLKSSWANRPISCYGRNTASGTYSYFKKVACFGGDYRDTVKACPGSSAVVNGVSEDLYGIGYSGMGYKTSGVKTAKLAAKEGGEFIEANAAGVFSGKYPLSRFLYVYVNKAPNKPLDPLVREFIAFVHSREGQQVVVKDGYLPLASAVVEKTQKAVSAGRSID